jgi:hypothetical protein
MASSTSSGLLKRPWTKNKRGAVVDLTQRNFAAMKYTRFYTLNDSKGATPRVGKLFDFSGIIISRSTLIQVLDFHFSNCRIMSHSAVLRDLIIPAISSYKML